jgi:hypothetical protein
MLSGRVNASSPSGIEKPPYTTMFITLKPLIDMKRRLYILSLIGFWGSSLFVCGDLWAFCISRQHHWIPILISGVSAMALFTILMSFTRKMETI